MPMQLLKKHLSGMFDIPNIAAQGCIENASRIIKHLPDSFLKEHEEGMINLGELVEYLKLMTSSGVSIIRIPNRYKITFLKLAGTQVPEFIPITLMATSIIDFNTFDDEVEETRHNAKK